MKYADPKRLILVAMAFVVVMTLCAAFAIWRMREDAITDALLENNNIATILAEQAGHSARAIEIILDDMVAQMQPSAGETDETYRGRLRSAESFDYLKDRLARLPQADAIGIVDSRGHMTNGTRLWPSPDFNLSDRDYFQHESQDNDPRMYISEPAPGLVSKLPTIYFAKRLQTPDGDFAGVIFVAVRPEYFIRALDVISTIPDRTFTMLRQDGTVLLRNPDQVDHGGFKIPASSDWYLYANTGGQYYTTSLFEKQNRWIVVRPVPQFPLVVDVGISENQVLAGWTLRALIIGGCCFLIEALFVILMVSLYCQFVRLRNSQLELTAKSRDVERVNQRFDSALSNTTHGIAMFDAQGGLVIKNAQFEEILGYHTIQFVTHESVLAARHDVEHTVLSDGDLTIWALPIDGRSDVVSLDDGRSIRITTKAMAEGGWVTTLDDITESQLANEKIIRMAHFDGLTKIANRTKFLLELRRFLAVRDQSDCGVMLLDLDRFKEVNDTYGHGVGDELLCSVAQRLVSELCSDDLVARLGGDEFAILCKFVPGEARDLDHLAKQLLDCVGAPFRLQNNDITVGLSIGLAFAQSGVHEVEQIMRHADLALYQAKSDGRNCHRRFEAALEERYHQRKALTIELAQAIKREELAVYYQPIVDATSLRIVCMEALVRWSHAGRGMISPADFVPLAEECGLIHELGELVLKRACVDAVKWPQDVRVAVNVSTLQLSRPTFSRIAERILSDAGLDPSRLKLEITESVLLAETQTGMINLNALRDLGIAISLDDFGTGYSSLSYLKRFQVDEIKIDRSFVSDLGHHRGSTAIVAATITLARELGIVTTAEGVETEDQRLLLRVSGVQQLQGYLFGKPAPVGHWTFDAIPAPTEARAAG